MARGVTSNAPDAFSWHTGDVIDMPFANGFLTSSICQQGFQFFPDEKAALKEIHRVLQPGGRFTLTVWAGPSRFFLTPADAIGGHVSPEDSTRSLAPFTYAGLVAIPELLCSCGFSDVWSTDLTV